jgi:hypothetical protein
VRRSRTKACWRNWHSTGPARCCCCGEGQSVNWVSCAMRATCLRLLP